MDDKLSAGKRAFLIESNRIIREAIYNLFAVQFIDTKGAVRVKRKSII
jgi:hypothetical protein